MKQPHPARRTIFILQATILSVLIQGAAPRICLGWNNLLSDPGFDQYYFDQAAGYWKPLPHSPWKEYGFGPASVRFDASDWTAPAEMVAERPLGFTPGTTGYEGPGATQNKGRITLQQDLTGLSFSGGEVYEAWVWVGGAGLDDDTGADHKDEAGGWDILFYSDPDPANWKESNALEIHHASLDYPGEPYRFVRVSGFGKVPNGATGMRFRAWASTWFGPAGPGNFNTRVAVDNAHFAIIQSPNLLVNGNFEQDDVVASFVGWTRPAEYPFPQNGQTPFDIRNVYGPNIDHGTFRPYWGGRRAYGYETYVYGAWIDDAFTFSQVVDVSERPPSPMTFMFYWLQDTAIPDKRAQLRHRGGRIGAVLQYLDENLQVISSEQHTIKWPVAANVINTCKTDQNAGEAYNPRFQLLPPAGTKKIRVNISVAMHLLYSPELSLTAHLVDDFYLGYSQGPDEIMNAAVDSVSHTTATLRWHTSNPGPSVVDYGTTTAYGQTVQLPTPTMMHQVQLAGLIPGAKYYYRIRAGNAVYPAPDDEAIAFFITRSRGDFDLDGDIDQSDFGILQACLSGAGNDQVSEPCRIARIDFDDDVDEADVAEFLACYSGPGGQYRTICP